LGKLEQARLFYQKAIALEPGLTAAHNFLGVLLCGQGDLANGEVCFRRAIQADPQNVDALNNLANVRKERGDFAEAERAYRRALELRPELSAAANNLGLLYLAVDRIEDAVDFFRRAVACDPANADANNNLGVALRRQGAPTDAEKAFRSALATNPAHAEALCGLGDVLTLRGALDVAEMCCLKAVELRPEYADALNNLATIAKVRGHLDVATAYCERALRVDANHLGALNGLASIATRRGNHVRAKSIYQLALEISPGHAVTRFNAGVNLLMLCEYKKGFEFYESRFDASGRHFSALSALDRALRSKPKWGTDTFRCENLLVWSEQGFGDALMMLRYLPALRALGVRAFTVLCDASLGRIVKCVEGVVNVVTSPEEALTIAFDAHCPMMSLPHAFGTTATTIPGSVPYVEVPKAMITDWRRLLDGDARPLIGLVWAGSRTLRDDARRSLSLEMLTPVLALDRYRFVSLQKGEAATEWTGNRKASDGIAACGDFLDTAAFIMTLDLVISVDTAVAHLAGAVGQPVWLLNRFGSEWRWGREAERTPWYPSMRIFNQHQPGDWSEVVDRLARALDAFKTRDESP
jgi:tetratricopeptide (TPR) repeat protein